MARAHRGHPFIVIPDVIPDSAAPASSSWTSSRGRSHAEIALLDQAERDRVAEMIFRCYFGSMYRHRAFSGDPHPGNSMLLDDGRMAFIDFGLFKRIADEAAESELAMARAGIEGRGEELIGLMAEAGMLRDPERATPEGVIAQFRGYTWWFTTDEELELDPTWRRASCSTSPTRRRTSSGACATRRCPASTSSAGAWR